jgi:hypothetical protein
VAGRAAQCGSGSAVAAPRVRGGGCWGDLRQPEIEEVRAVRRGWRGGTRGRGEELIGRAVLR